MIEFKLKRFQKDIKLLAYDEVTSEFLITYKEFNKTSFVSERFSGITYPKLVSILEILKTTAIHTSSRFGNTVYTAAFHDFTPIKLDYVLTDVSSAVVDGKSVVNVDIYDSDYQQQILDCIKENNPSFTESDSILSEDVESVIPALPKSYVKSLKSKKNFVSPSEVTVQSSIADIEAPLPSMQVPFQFRTPAWQPKGLLYDCTYQVSVMTEPDKDTSPTKKHNLPIFILANSVSELDAIFQKYIDNKIFPDNFKVVSYTLLSARVIASTTFNEAIPLLAH